MKILISPAKSLDYDRNVPTPETSIPQFIEEADYLAKKLGKFSAGKFEKMMHISKDLGELNFQRYQAWERPTALNENVKPAATVFTGEVYRGLAIETFTEDELKKAQEDLRILSGLYGMLKPLDLMYPYRLEMGTKWAVTPKKTNLYKFWGDKIADALNDEMQEGEFIVNLASNEYFKVVNKKKIKAEIITPTFKDLKGDTYKTIMMYAKNARGAMAKQIIQEGIKTIDEIKTLNIDGYQYSESMSEGNEFVFIR
ncbi:hypothetical protein SAMN05216474_0857 [Lishizhenia tianjinensis]|uniref:UPF0246 protein SAMN05216474_0857 n=1 Tax=Lishizhenia tianjinensis TaxID=477690 RepID=A0A1I6YFU9_9FLAO|nr:peroxide stress protein YaaA [Lishizhenia tianjinensis]SFT49084.1 hypothetical protein SAMN05216474_0857 [Lishizhenia tianjinensis]